MCSLLHLDHGCLTRTSHGSVDTAVSAEEPMWPKCRREAQVEFLRKDPVASKSDDGLLGTVFRYGVCLVGVH